MLKRILPVMVIVLAAALYTQASAETTITIQNNLPNIVFKAEPELIVVPGTYIYYTSSADNDIFFYEGFWWRPWRGSWFRANIYSGPWTRMEERRVPYTVTHMPPRWKEARNDAVRVKWNDTRSHWREWQRDKYWDKHGWKRGDTRQGDQKENPRDRNRGKNRR